MKSVNFNLDKNTFSYTYTKKDYDRSTIKIDISSYTKEEYDEITESKKNSAIALGYYKRKTGISYEKYIKYYISLRLLQLSDFMDTDD